MTERLYYYDSYLLQFKASVIQFSQTDKGYEIVLDRTAFYPTSGGQLHDLGKIQESLIQDVFENEKGEIIHRINKPVEGGDLHCAIDWARRFDHMQQHTGQHVLSQAFLRTSKLNTIGFHMAAHYATIDLEVENISPEQIHQAEDLANAIVYENRPIKVRVVPPEEIPHLGLRKESQREGPLRVVEVQDFDVSACGGTHVKLTGEIGAIVIRKVERVNRQARIEFVCGGRALQCHRTDLQNLDTIARKFSVGLQEAPQRVEKHLEENKQLRKILQEKNKSLAHLFAKELYERAPQYEGFKIIKHLFEGEEIGFVKLLAQSAIAQGPCVVLLGNKGGQAQVVLAQSESLPWDLPQLVAQCCRLIEGKGGGTRTLVQGGGKNPSQLPFALDFVEALILSK